MRYVTKVRDKVVSGGTHKGGTGERTSKLGFAVPPPRLFGRNKGLACILAER